MTKKLENNPALISEARVQDVCGLGKGGATCSYLVGTPDGFGCGKKSWAEGAISERRLAGTIKAMGDNCSGPPDFR